VLGDGRAFAEQFAAGGQVSLNRLIGQMAGTVENVASNRLNLVLGLDKNHMLRASQVEGWPSGTSQAIALALLIGTQRLYEGKGRLGDLVKPVAPAIDERIRSGFAEAVVAVEKLGAPLEQIVKVDRPALEGAVTATKALELAMKVDLASALGITITFQSGDGD
jgi:predicted lipoprotein